MPFKADSHGMEAGASSRLPGRSVAATVALAALWWVAFEQGDRIPIFTYANLGIHEFGHLLTYGFPDLVMAMMGSILQVAAPLLLAVYFFVCRGDWAGAGLCLAWAATSSLEVAVYVADASVRDLVLIGGMHDWAYILGPDGYDAIEKAAPLADTIRSAAAVALITGAALCVGSIFRHRPHTSASARAVTPVSSPWAASAPSGSAPGSASGPR